MREKSLQIVFSSSGFSRTSVPLKPHAACYKSTIYKMLTYYLLHHSHKLEIGFEKDNDSRYNTLCFLFAM